MDKTLVDDLKLTLAPRKSKPGSVEALIDDLTDHWESGEWGSEEGQTAYWKLVERGLDAVPALLDHLNDTRVTRYKWTGVKGVGDGIYIVRVRDLVEDILNGLSGSKFVSEAYPLTEDQLIEPKDHKWWARARRTGEEQWLLDNALPEEDKEREPRSPNEIILRVVQVKYPHWLKEVYQTALFKWPQRRSDQITKAILASTLPRDQKRSLLVQGATSEIDLHRSYALEALFVLEAGVFRKHLLQTLKGFRRP